MSSKLLTVQPENNYASNNTATQHAYNNSDICNVSLNRIMHQLEGLVLPGLQGLFDFIGGGRRMAENSKFMSNNGESGVD